MNTMTNAEIKNARRAAQDLLDASATSPTGIAVEQRALAAQILAGPVATLERLYREATA